MQRLWSYSYPISGRDLGNKFNKSIMPKVGSSIIGEETGAQERRLEKESAARELEAAKATARDMVAAAEKGVREAGK